MKTRSITAGASQRKRQELGQELRRRRMAAKLTQQALAETAGISRKAVAEVESGKADYPVDSFVRVCLALDVVVLPVGFDVVMPGTVGPKKPFDIH